MLRPSLQSDAVKQRNATPTQFAAVEQPNATPHQVGVAEKPSTTPSQVIRRQDTVRPHILTSHPPAYKIRPESVSKTGMNGHDTDRQAIIFGGYYANFLYE